MAKESDSYYTELLERDAAIKEGEPNTVIKYIERTFGPKEYQARNRHRDYEEYFKKFKRIA